MSTAVAVPAINLGLLEVTCGSCGFLVPPYKRTEVLAKDALRAERAVCPTCGAEYRVCLQRTKETNLCPEKLSEIRNRNR